MGVCARSRTACAPPPNHANRFPNLQTLNAFTSKWRLGRRDDMPTPAADETAIRDGHHFAKIFAFDAIRAANRVHCRPLGGRTYSRLNDLEGQRILPQRGA